MNQIYEGMFLLDNQVVRESWETAKTDVTGTLAKYGGEVITARRWDERRLSYPIEGRLRATYLLTYYRIPSESIQAMRRDFDLSERVLRYLMLAVDVVPEAEQELSEAENADDFSVPAPPADDAPDPEPEPEPTPEASAASDAPAAQAQGAAEAETKAAAPAEADAGTEASAEADAGTEAPAEADAGTEAPAEADAGTEAPAEADAGTEASAEAPAEADAESSPPAADADGSTTKEEA